MSGLFINIFPITLQNNYIKVGKLPFISKDDFHELHKNYQDYYFYRFGDNIFFWNLTPRANLDKIQGEIIDISLYEYPQIFKKIVELAIINLFQNKLDYKIKYKIYSGVWEIISDKDLLNDSIEGLKVNRKISISTFSFIRDENSFIGIKITSNIKNTFTWSKTDFEKNGIETKNLKGIDNIIFANRQSISQFLQSTGKKEIYESCIESKNSNNTNFQTILKIYKWINNNIPNIFINNNKIQSISMKYLPFENLKSKNIFNPKRYYFEGTPSKGERLYFNQQVQKYKPFSFELFENKTIKIGILASKENEGIIKIFIKNLNNKLNDDLHLKNINYKFCYTSDNTIKSYKDNLYDDNLLDSDLIIIFVTDDHEKFIGNESPYYYCKAKYIGNGIPTQDIKISTIKNWNHFILNNISLNIYAKLGGTAWTIEKEEKIKNELVIGIGSTVTNNKYVLGIAQIFQADGKYIVGECAPLSTFDNYSENLTKYLTTILTDIFQNYFDYSEEFRLIFHIFKSPSNKYEIKAVNNIINNFNNIRLSFSLIHLSYGHDFRLFMNDGKGKINKGTYLKLSRQMSLLHFIENSILPLLIRLDHRSTFTDIFYLSKQIYWFSKLSHRSYIPSKKTVTLLYPSLMASLTEKLKSVDGWDYDRLKKVGDKLWFI